MSVTTDTTDQSQTTMTARLAVRVSGNAPDDLATATERRLGNLAGVQTATVDGLHGLDPQLAATVVTVAVTITTSDSQSALRETLSVAVGIETITELTTDA